MNVFDNCDFEIQDGRLEINSLLSPVGAIVMDAVFGVWIEVVDLYTHIIYLYARSLFVQVWSW